MADIRSKIIGILKDYPKKQRKIAQLRIELEHPARIGEKELIETLSLGGRSLGKEDSPKGHISNKTMMIALQYQDTVQKMNGDTVINITQELHTLEAEVAKLERYVSLLEKYQGDIIRLYYFDEHSWTELENMLNLSRRTLFKHRNEAVDELAKMYQFIEQVKNASREL